MKRGTLHAVFLGAASALTAAGAALLLLGSRPAATGGEKYRLGDYGGRVAVYCPGEGTLPREITAIPVQLLPAADRAQLREGIPARDGRELAMLLEDLGS